MQSGHHPINIIEVLLRIQNGDRQAFALIVKEFERPLFGFLGRMGLTQGLAEDLAQETFLRAWKSLGQYEPTRGAFSTWLFTIARNLAFNELDRASYLNEIQEEEGTSEQACAEPQPPESLALAQRKQRLRNALWQLPAAERSTVALAYVKELELAEVARIEGCSIGAVKTRLHRARRRLSQFLEKDDVRQSG